MNKMKDKEGLDESDLAEQELDELDCWLYIKKNKKGDVKVKCITHPEK